jgi:hypothetical protein
MSNSVPATKVILPSLLIHTSALSSCPFAIFAAFPVLDITSPLNTNSVLGFGHSVVPATIENVAWVVPLFFQAILAELGLTEKLNLPLPPVGDVVHLEREALPDPVPKLIVPVRESHFAACVAALAKVGVRATVEVEKSTIAPTDTRNAFAIVLFIGAPP